MFHDLLTLIAPFMIALSLGGITPTAGSSCIPPVSPKPQSKIEANKFGTITITPEISVQPSKVSSIKQQEIVTIAVTPNIEAKSIIITEGPFFQRASLVDWGPQDQPKLVDFTFNSSNGSLIFSRPRTLWDAVRGIRKPMPAHRSYWVKLYVGETVPENSGENIDSYGWSDIRYLIERDATDWGSGTGLYFVNGPQDPSVRVGRIGNQILSRANERWFLKPVVVKPNKTFEFEVEALGQDGTISIPPGSITGAEIVGPQTLAVKADETAIFNIKPSKNTVSIRNVEIKNSCGDSRAVIGESEIPIQSALGPQVKVPAIEPVKRVSPPPAPDVKSVPPSPILNRTPPTTSPQTSTTPRAKVSYVAIAPSRSLDGLVEGDQVTFAAIIAYQDGTQRPATASDKILWSVIGKIGSINTSGVFTAKLDPSILEIGEGIGTVTALYTDSTGAPFLSKTQTFKVEAVFLDDGNTQG